MDWETICKKIVSRRHDTHLKDTEVERVVDDEWIGLLHHPMVEATLSAGIAELKHPDNKPNDLIRLGDFIACRRRDLMVYTHLIPNPKASNTDVDPYLHKDKTRAEWLKLVEDVLIEEAAL